MINGFGILTRMLATDSKIFIRFVLELINWPLLILI